MEGGVWWFMGTRRETRTVIVLRPSGQCGMDPGGHDPFLMAVKGQDLSSCPW